MRRFIASVVCACSLAVLAESAPPVGVCFVDVPEDGSLTTLHVLRLEAAECARTNMSPKDAEAMATYTTEQLRLVYKRACADRTNFTECLARVRVDADACLEGLEKTRFLLTLGLMETVYDVDCLDNGARSIVIYERQREYWSSGDTETRDVVNMCSVAAGSSVGPAPSDRSDNPNSELVHDYRVMLAAMRCLEKHRGGDQDTLVDAGVTQWRDTLNRIKCRDPQDGTEVLCKTIIDTNN